MAISQEFDRSFAGKYQILSAQSVGPKVGADLRRQAVMATLYALGGILVYIAFRFEWIYGVAAVLATFHDVIIAIGFLSLFNYEISLTVIAALLTLVGYSVNDTVVVFDRIRENRRRYKRLSLRELINLSTNQTLARTVLTSACTAFDSHCSMSFWPLGTTSPTRMAVVKGTPTFRGRPSRSM